MRAPLTCNVVDRHAVRYFLAGLAGDLLNGLERHFAHCRRCRRKLELLERVWRRDGERRAASDDTFH